MYTKKCAVKMEWVVEDGLGTWCAESEDIPGMATGAPTFEKLVEKVCIIAPEMLECNLNYIGPITLDFITVRTEHLDFAAVS